MIPQRTLQAGFQSLAVQDSLMHLLAKDDGAAPTCVFGLIHRNIAGLQQLFDARSVGRELSDADTGGNRVLTAVDFDRWLERCDDSVRALYGLLCSLRIGDQH